MEKLNQLSKLDVHGTKILSHLIDLAYKSSQDEPVTLRLDNSKGIHMPLYLEIPYTGYKGTNFQDWKIVQITNYFEWEGSTICNPVMCFLFKEKTFIPYYYRNDNMGVEQDLIDVTDLENIDLNPKVIELQMGLVDYANLWLIGIHSEQKLGISPYYDHILVI